MVKHLVVGAVLLGAMAAQGQAQGQTIPFPGVECTRLGPPSIAALEGPQLLAFAQSSDGTACINLSAFAVPIGDGKLTRIQVQGVTIGDLARLSINTTLNPDPFITFGATTTNLVAGPVTYAFLFATPVAPGLYGTASSTGGVTVTNGASGTSSVSTSAIYPTFISAYGTVGATPTNLGVDLGSATCTASGTAFQVTKTCPQGTALNTFAPTFYDNLEVLLTYDQSDLASVSSWSGAATLNPSVVPEPGTVTLVLVGLAGVAAAARRRRAA